MVKAKIVYKIWMDSSIINITYENYTVKLSQDQSKEFSNNDFYWGEKKWGKRNGATSV